MPRKCLLRTNWLPYHVTVKTNNSELFHLPIERLWGIIGLECLNLSLVYETEIHALVLMPNHLHMLITVPDFDLGKVMNVFISSVTKTANLLSARSGHLFGGPYYWSLINNTRYFGHALKYVYRNPVRANLCPRVQDYRYSTIHGLVGQSHLPFPIHLTRSGLEINLPSVEAHEQLDWLNSPFSAEVENLIQKGLKRKLFQAVIDRKTRTQIDPLAGLL